MYSLVEDAWASLVVIVLLSGEWAALAVDVKPEGGCLSLPRPEINL